MNHFLAPEQVRKPGKGYALYQNHFSYWRDLLINKFTEVAISNLLDSPTEMVEFE